MSAQGPLPSSWPECPNCLAMSKTLKVRIRDKWYTVEVLGLCDSSAEVLVDGQHVGVELHDLPNPDPIAENPSTLQLEAPSGRRPAASQASSLSATKAFRSPMPGTIVSVAVKEGDQVVTGDEICVLEAMKMQQVLRADWSGIVRVVHVHAGQQMLDGDIILELE